MRTVVCKGCGRSLTNSTRCDSCGCDSNRDASLNGREPLRVNGMDAEQWRAFLNAQAETGAPASGK